MRLKKLVLKNFKGIATFELSPDQKDVTSIFGANATGKTTLVDGFTWLLFGKDSLNSAVFDIKSLDKTGEAAHGLDHTVEATLIESTGRETDLKKVYSEKWVKRRGSATREFTGHTIDHFIDGVPVKEKEYKAAVNEICNEETFRLLTSPRFFNEHLNTYKGKKIPDWQARRDLLLEVCGDISDSDVIASDDKLSDLPDILGKRKLEDHKKVIASKRIEINRELDKIPVRIDEIKSSEVETREKKIINTDIILAKDEHSEASDILKEIKAGGESAVLTTSLREIENKIGAIDNAQAARDLKKTQDRNTETARLKEILLDAGGDVNSALRKHDQLVDDKKEREDRIEVLAATNKGLRKQWQEEDARTFEYESSGDTCPACGQSIPEEKLEAAREKALSAFNELKAKCLAEITKGGKTRAVKIGLEQNELVELGKKITATNSEIKEYQKKSIEAGEALEKFSSKGEDKEMALAMVLKNPERVSLIDQKLDVEKQISDLKAGVDADSIIDADEAMETIENRIEGFQKELLQVQANGRIDARIQELKDQERKLSSEFEELERQLFLCESFIRSKVGMLDEKINSRFKLARFQLFTNNINGGLEDVCNTTFKGVPYASMNNSARINIGLDICNTLSEHYDKSMPCFIDNSESITKIQETGFQQIRLYVSESDKTLRVE